MISPEKVSIIVPTLNCRKTLPATLESLVPLQIAGAEIIVVDSFSDDGSAELGRSFADEFMQVPAGNMYSAINAGMRHSKREWLSYINADDILYADTIVKCLSIVPDEVDLIYGSLDYIDGEGRFLHGFIMPPPEDFLSLAAEMINGVPPQGAFYSRKLFEAINGFNEKFRLAGDFDFFIRACMAGFRFHLFERPAMAAYRMHAQQYSQRENTGLYDEGMVSLADNQVEVPRSKRKLANIRFRLRNLNSYLLRILRARNLAGRFALPDTMFFSDK